MRALVLRVVCESLGQLEFGSDGVAVTSVDVGGRSVEVEVTFDDKPNAELLKTAAKLLEDPGKLDAMARRALAADLASGEEDSVALFKNHHLEELEQSDLLECFAVKNVSEIDDKVFLKGLQLHRIGLSPEEEDDMLVCDYGLNPETTDYLLAVMFDSSGEIVGVEMES